jgi:hypothetical protein
MHAALYRLYEAVSFSAPQRTLLLLALVTLGPSLLGCSRKKPPPPTVAVSFETGPVETITLPVGFQIVSEKQAPWTITAQNDGRRFFTLRVELPGDKNWASDADYRQDYTNMSRFVRPVRLNGRQWLIVPMALKGFIAISSEQNSRLFFAAKGRWKYEQVTAILKTITSRPQQ